MTGKEFDGKGVKLATPEGGHLHFAVGTLTRDEASAPEPAVAVQITDALGGEVAKFCLTRATYAVLVEAQHRTLPLVADWFKDRRTSQDPQP